MNLSQNFYAVRMTAQQRKESYFPELQGEEQQSADEWLDGYLRLVIRIWHGHLEGQKTSSYPQVAVDDAAGTGNVTYAPAWY